MKFKKYSFVMLIIILIASSTFALSGDDWKFVNYKPEKPILSNSYDAPDLTDLLLVTHAPIMIESDGDFITYSFPGFGTETDPYRIENLSITTTIAESAISVSDTTKYFVIKNCYLSANYDGIFLERVAKGTGTIEENTCANSDLGISLWSSQEVRIFNNTIQNNGISGLWLWKSGYSIVKDNEFIKDTLYIKEDNELLYASYIIEDNTVNGKKLGYITNVQNEIIDEPEYGHLLIVGCDNLVIENQYITDVDGAIRTYYCDKLTIRENTIKQCEGSLTLTDTTDSTIENNSITNNLVGISLWGADYCEIKFNLLENNGGEGVELWGLSDNNVVHHNWFIDNNLDGDSQGFDVGTGNIWYDEDTKEGNYWSDYGGMGDYEIGTHSWITDKPVDKYPLNEDLQPASLLFLTVPIALFLLVTTYNFKRIKKGDKKNEI